MVDAAYSLLCACGCGQKTSRIEKSDRARGYVKGEYRRFVTGHNGLRESRSDGMMQCTTCNMVLPADLDNFPSSSSTRNGLDGRCRRCQRIRDNMRTARLKHEVMTSLCAGDDPRCACCGEENIAFLTVDHVNGDGADHRRSLSDGGQSLYRWLKKSGFPTDGFQVLCWNCNRAKYVLGQCPHSS